MKEWRLCRRFCLFNGCASGTKGRKSDIPAQGLSAPINRTFYTAVEINSVYVNENSRGYPGTIV